MSLTLEKVFAKLPMVAIIETIRSHAKSMIDRPPDKRLGRALEQAIAGIQVGQTPIVTVIARHNSKTDVETWSVAKRV